MPGLAPQTTTRLAQSTERHYPKVKMAAPLSESENVSSKSGKSKHRIKVMQGHMISRPSKRELQLNTSDLSDEDSAGGERLEIKLPEADIVSQRLSVYFIADALLESMRAEDRKSFDKVM